MTNLELANYCSLMLLFSHMRTYELMLILTHGFDADSEKKREEVVKKLLGDKVAIPEITSWGKKELAYPIKKQTEGVYLLATVEADGLLVGEVEKQARLIPDVLRYLLTVKE